MTDDSRVDDLLEWLLESGETPEVVCRDCPELLPQVRAGWRHLRAVEEQLSELFPDSRHSDAAAPVASAADELPRIPGYELESVLGRGGMGVVYKGRHVLLNRTVAIKRLLAGAAARPQELERFFHEAEIVAGLHHPNIVELYDVGDVDGCPYFTMEFVPGGSLAQKLTGIPQPALQAAALVAALADAIHVAHQKGIIHRDLKPGNILLTVDGVPKVSDFGLARRLEAGHGLTLTGSPVGTPSYMAPEQVQGRKDAIGPATDVYPLGTILYELLTGRPPFRSDTAAATLQQVLTDDPAPPARLNGRVPRDLETICLKCLRKEPSRRYPTALALADDLRCFLAGEPIAGRRPGMFERLVLRARRRPTESALLAAAAILAMILVGGGVWLASERMRTTRAVQAELRDIVRFQQQGALAEAAAALERARVRLGQDGPSWLHAALEDAERDQGFVGQVRAIRLNRTTLLEGIDGRAANDRSSRAQADRDYEAAFRDRRLCKPLDEPTQIADRVNDSPLRETLVSALDDWLVCTTDVPRQEWLMSVARHADPDAWRSQIRNPTAWANGPKLSELSTTGPLSEQPVPFLVALGERLEQIGVDGVTLLRQVQNANPDDFWANLTLASALHIRGRLSKDDLDQSLVYYRKALELQPRAAVVYNNFGLALYYEWYLDDDPSIRATEDNPSVRGRGALSLFRQALLIDSDFAPALNNLGAALRAKGDWPEALSHFQEAVRLRPALAEAHANLGHLKAGMGGINEAIDQYRQALKINPQLAEVHEYFGVALLAKGCRDEVDECFPEGAKAVDQDRGRGLKEALEVYKRADRLDPQWVPARNKLHLSSNEAALVNEAIEHFREAIRIDSGRPRSHGALGQALLAKGELADAKTAIERGLELLPAGELQLRENLQRQRQRCDHLLSLKQRLPALVQGADKPDTSELLEAAEMCFIDRHYVTATRLFAEAFATDRSLCEDLRAGHRLNAACAAVLAELGRGDDGSSLAGEQRKTLRQEARRYLSLDLAAWRERVDRGTAADCIVCQRTLSLWRQDPDLDGVRDSRSLDRLPEDERADWLALWNDVDALLQRAVSRGVNPS